MFDSLIQWYKDFYGKLGGMLATLIVILLFLALSALVIFLMTQGVPYAMKYLTRFFSEVKIGQWVVGITLGLAGITLLWIVIRK